MSKMKPRPWTNVRDLYIYIALAVVGIAARLPFFRNFELVTYDGTYYLNEAKALISAEKLPGAFPTGYPAVTALFHLVIRDWTLAGQMVSFVAGITATLLLYKLLRDRTSQWIAALAVCLMSLNPLFMRLTMMTMSESLYICLVLLALLLITRKRAQPAAFAAGLAMGAATATRPEGIAVVGIVALFHLRVPRRLVLIVLGFLVPFALDTAVLSWSKSDLTVLSKSGWLGSGTQEWHDSERTIEFEMREEWRENEEAGEQPRSLVAYYLHRMPGELALLLRHTYPVLLILAAWGIWRTGLHVFLAPLVSLAFFTLFTKRPEDRYILPYIPPLLLYAGLGLGALKQKRLRVSAMALLAVGGVALLVWERAQLTTTDEQMLMGVKEAGAHMRPRIDPNDRIADRKPHLAFYAGARYVEIPAAPYDDTVAHLADEGVEWMALQRETIETLRPALRPLMYSKAVINGELRYDQVYRRATEMVFQLTRREDPLRWTQVTTGPAADRMAKWAPDGERVAFRRKNEDGSVQLMVASRRNRVRDWSIDNVEVEEVAWIDDLIDALAWSPDGERIAFTRRNTGERTDLDIVAVDVFGGDVELLAGGPADERSPSWPRESLLVYWSTQSGGDDIWMTDTAAGEATRLTQSGDCKFPMASPDGGRIAWVTNGKGVGILDLETGAVLQAQAPRNVVYPPAWSPDGEFLAVTANDWGSWDIYLMKTDATNVLLLTKRVFRDATPTWRPDGGSMIIESDRDGTYDLWLLDNLEPYRQRLGSRARMDTFTPLAAE